ncbi:MAG: hypothetical protein JWP06_233 [Candidatus Saccharibacteria bacterium]|nr:hypothetical protein [Candidatus Saccharibacteria bacterium]
MCVEAGSLRLPVEVAVLDAADERVPLGTSENQRRPGLVLGVTNCHDVAHQGHFGAVAARIASPGFLPGSTLNRRSIRHDVNLREIHDLRSPCLRSGSSHSFTIL